MTATFLYNFVSHQIWDEPFQLLFPVEGIFHNGWISKNEIETAMNHKFYEWGSNWIKSFEQKLFCQVVIKQEEILEYFTFILLIMEVMKPWNLTTLSSDQNSEFIQLL